MFLRLFDSGLLELGMAEKAEIDKIMQSDDVDALNVYLSSRHFDRKLALRLIYEAAKSGCLKCTTYLIETGVNPNAFIFGPHCSFFEGTIFKLAAGSGNLELVRFLCEKYNADIESQSSQLAQGCRSTALSCAVRNGHQHIAEYLIVKGANVNPEIAFDRNILQEALAAGSLSLFKLLVDNGVRFDKFILTDAIKAGRLDIAEYVSQLKSGIETHVIFASEMPTLLAAASGNANLLKFLQESKPLEILQPSSSLRIGSI